MRPLRDFTMKPIHFSVDAYIHWHEAEIAGDVPFRDKLTSLRSQLMVDVRQDLELLYKILTYMFTYARNEFATAHQSEITYQTPLQNALLATSSAAAYESLFKPFDSIVNKMWRKSGEDRPAVEIDAVYDRITDLIRTDIRTDTLQSAEFLAHRMNGLPGFLYLDELRTAYEDRIVSCAFESEMKMASGYFAYHGLVKFKPGYSVEVQIYSALMAEWRRLSHLLYEQVRITPIEHHEFASKESRLISLGHMLHLAECEIQRLSKDMKHP